MLRGQMLHEQISPWRLESGLDVHRNLPLKFHQNRVSNSWDIADIEFVWVGGVGGVHSHYIVKPNLVLRLSWGFDNYSSSAGSPCIFPGHMCFSNFRFLEVAFLERNLTPVLLTDRHKSSSSPGNKWWIKWTWLNFFLLISRLYNTSFCIFFINPTCAYYGNDPKSILKHWVTTLCGWVLLSLGGGQPFLGGEFFLDGVALSWVLGGLLKNVCHHQ